MPDDHKSKTFTWTSPNDVKITLPSMRSIKAGVLRKHRKAEMIDFMFSILEDISDEETLAKVDELETTDLNSMFEAWQEDGQATVGESSGSST